MKHWMILGIAAVSLGTYIALVVWTRRKQREFKARYESSRERHEVLVLIKRTTRKNPESGMLRFFKFKTYEVVGKLNLSQTMKGVRVSRMQTVTFQTTRSEYRKIEPYHSYRMDVAGDYIGYVAAPPLPGKKGRGRGIKAWANGIKKSLFDRKENASHGNAKYGKHRK